ncbi:MAG: amidohydrolase family protein [Actinomycetota bacterium]|nr:amidohydrolase family protein [Actinomycetota bacterium]
MRIVDVHTHAFSDALAPGAIASLEAAGDVRALYDGTVAGLIAAMDRCGVDVSVIQPVATKPSQVASINDWAATTASERIVPFGAMHPDFPNPAEEIARMAALGLRGFKLHPEYQSFEPHDPRMGAMYDAAIEHGMIVLFHAGADIIYPTVRGTAESFAAMLDQWPGLVAILAHLGGFQRWDDVARLLAGRDVWLDTAYTLGRLPDDEWVSLVRAHGADRVLFGSDGPWTDVAHEIAHLRRTGLDADEVAAVLGGNAERLLGL